MYSPSLQHLFVQAHVQELHRSRRTSSAKPITTTDRTVTRRRNTVKLSAYFARVIEHLVGHPGPGRPAV
jgi:hypothetical protein